jgi:hypothetical protein
MTKTLTFVPQTGEKAYYHMPYKEPFMPIEDGYGYYGVLLVNDEDKIQCHICGDWVNSLAPHVRYKHEIPKVSYYKDKFGFKHSTALINERMRTALINSMRNSQSEGKVGIKFLKNRAGASFTNEMRRKSAQGEKTAQYKNEHFSCRAQLLFRLKAMAQKFGDDVSGSQIKTVDKSLTSMLAKEFGTFSYAHQLAGLLPTKRMKTLAVTKEAIAKDVLHFYDEYKRIPSNSDLARGKLIAGRKLIDKHFGSLRECIISVGLKPFEAHPVLDNLPVIEAIQLYTKGYSMDMLAKKYQCSTTPIRNLLIRNGIKIWPIGTNKERYKGIHGHKKYRSK